MRLRSDLREFLHYILPNVTGMLGLSCYILADTYFISKALGSNGLAALNLAIPIYSFIHGCGLMLGMGGATRYSILYHQGKETDSQRVYTHTLGLGAVLALLFFLCGLFGVDAITHVLGTDEEIFVITRTYLQVLLLFSPLFLLNDIILPFVRNDGAPRLAMIGLMASSLSNIILDYIFIFPLELGIFGAVLATSIAPGISLLLLLPFFLKRKNSFRPVLCLANPRTAGIIATLGLPSLVTEVSAGIVMIVFNRILLSLQGNLGIAAYGVVSNLALVVTAIYTGIAQGSQPLLSRDYGAGNTLRIRRFLGYALGCTLLLSFGIYTVILLGAHPIAALFNSEGDPRLQTMAVQGLILYFTSCFFTGTNVVLATYFSSIEHSRPANTISLLRGLVIVVPMAFLLSTTGGITGLWFTVTATELLVTIYGLYFYRALKT